MPKPSLFMQMGNLFSRALLRSPLHGAVSRSVLLVEYRGRRSGRRYSVPVNYWQEGDQVFVVSFRNRTWWRNLRGGQPVALWLRGVSRGGKATVIEVPERVSELLYRQIQAASQYARFYGVLPTAGQPLTSADLTPAAQTRVVILIELTPNPQDETSHSGQ